MAGVTARPSHADDLDGTLAEAMRLIARGASDRRSPFHTPSVATIGCDGRPKLRTVVLRAFDPVARTLRFHTDSRSAKIAELEADPSIALHGYDPAAKIQIRIEGRATIHGDDPIGEAAWSASQRMSRACYAVVPGPGTPMAGAGDFTLPETDVEIGTGRIHFRAIVVAMDRLEWLWLAHGGHRRAEFAFAPGAEVSARWLVP